jgi:DNA-binding SARP family transcriptional activator
VRVEARLLGGFAIRVDGVDLPAAAWRRRQAAALVKLLALAPNRRLHRERVLDALWPDLSMDVAATRLHKAAHFARTTLGCPDAVVLRDEVVALFPAATVIDDVGPFVEAADAAFAAAPDDRPGACRTALERYGGELLPDDVYEPWTDEARERVRARWQRLLRLAQRWDDALALDPADEEAHLELLRSAVVAGNRAAALRRFERMERALELHLGVGPSPEGLALRERALALRGGPDPAGPVDRPTPVVARPVDVTVGGRPGAARLLERDAELLALADAVDGVERAGRGIVVLVAGEAGSGKTALLRAFLDGLGERVAVLAGGCDDLLAPPTLGPFRDMAAGHAELAAAFAASGHPDVVFPALVRTLAAGTAVVVIEDLHWADDATLDAVRYLARRIPGLPAALVLSFRDDDLDAAHPLRQVLGTLTGSPVRRLDLAPLSEESVASLAGGTTDARELHAVTRGNPFFVTEILAAHGTDVPRTVRDAVLARVGRLSPVARAMVQRLSVVPSRAERWLAERLARGEAGAVADAERAGVLGGAAGHVWFRHELARRAVEAALTAGERIQANREVLEALVERPDVEPSRIVHHAEQADRPDLLLRFGPAAAAESARLGAHRQAAETLRVVLEHARALAPSAVAELLTRRAYSLYVVNRFEDSFQSASAAVAVAESLGEPAVLADALAVLSKAVFWARGPMAARAAARRAVDLLESQDDAARLCGALTDLARAHSNLATLGIVAEPSREAAEHAARALALGRQLGRTDLQAQPLCYVGSARLAQGDPAGAADLDESIAMIAADPRAELRVRVYVNAAGSAYRAGRLDDAGRYVAAGLRHAADGEFFAGEYRLQLTMAAVEASRGNWDRAIADLRTLVSSVGEPGIMRPLAGSLLARLLARRGEDGAAVLEAAQADPAARDDVQVAGPLAVARVELAWLAGRGHEVRPLVAPVLEAAAAAGHRSYAAELSVYLRRAGHVVDAPPDAPGPWAASLAGRWRDAAAAWQAAGERYEHAVELAASPDERARDEGRARLVSLGARATADRLRARP